MFFLVPAYPGCPGSKAVKRSLLLLFCYIGDMLSVDGDADAAVEARIRIDWNKFRQLVPLLTNKDVSSEMTYIVSSGALNSTPTNQL